MLFSAALAFTLALALSLSIRRLSLGAGVVDIPDFCRKLNTSPIPRLGGVAFFLAYFTSLAVMGAMSEGLSALDSTLIFSGGLSLLFGAADDFFDLSPLEKLALQLLCASSALLLLPMRYPTALSLLFIILMMNAYNFIDGLDGLATSLSLSSLLFISLSCLLFLNTGMGVSPILLFFALLGFLPLNAHPASLYMGETGSSTLGLTIALITLTLPPPTALLSLAFSLIPIIDTLLAVPRRLFAGRSPFLADMSSTA